MSRWWSVPSHTFRGTLAVILAACLLAVGSGLALANEPPTAEAGLDQTVDVETTVYLDAGGSSDPDGAIANTTWTVHAPNGTDVTTSCSNCTRTQFTPTQPGRYEATVSVTDAAGARRNDTLYVTARAVQRPTIAIGGPAETTTDTETEFVLQGTSGDAALLDANLSVDDESIETVSIAADENATISHTFTETGNYTLRATVRDVDGYANHTNRTVTVEEGFEPTQDVCGHIIIYGADGAETTQPCSEYFEGDLTVYLEDRRFVRDLDKDGSIPIGGETRTTSDESESSLENEYTKSESSVETDSRERSGHDYSNWGP